jgi:hypothetical protein
MPPAASVRWRCHRFYHGEPHDSQRHECTFPFVLMCEKPLCLIMQNALSKSSQCSQSSPQLTPGNERSIFCTSGCAALNIPNSLKCSSAPVSALQTWAIVHRKWCGCSFSCRAGRLLYRSKRKGGRVAYEEVGVCWMCRGCIAESVEHIHEIRC